MKVWSSVFRFDSGGSKFPVTLRLSAVFSEIWRNFYFFSIMNYYSCFFVFCFFKQKVVFSSRDVTFTRHAAINSVTSYLWVSAGSVWRDEGDRIKNKIRLLMFILLRCDSRTHSGYTSLTTDVTQVRSRFIVINSRTERVISRFVSVLNSSMTFSINNI